MKRTENLSKINSTITREQADLRAFITGFLTDPAHDKQSADSLTAKVFRIALAAMDSELVYQVLSDDAWIDVSKGAVEAQQSPDVIQN